MPVYHPVWGFAVALAAALIATVATDNGLRISGYALMGLGVFLIFQSYHLPT